MTDLATLKTTFEQRLRQLTNRAVKIDRDLRKPGDNDWTEHAVESENDEALEEIGESTVQEIEQIKLAVKQINDGTYGTCSECEKAIAPARLAVLPYAVKCIKCA